MSNQNATVNRVTLLEHIAAAKNSVERITHFQNLTTDIRNDLWEAMWWLDRARMRAKELEAWGDGP